MIVAEGGQKIERLLIVRLSAMGDVIHTLPAAFALREAFPEARNGASRAAVGATAIGGLGSSCQSDGVAEVIVHDSDPAADCESLE